MNVTMTPILSALGGRWGWRFWWPVLPWLVDVGMVLGFRRGAIEEPAGVLLVAALFGVAMLWLWGARFAVSLGHARRHVYPVGVLATFTSIAAWAGLTGVSGVLLGRDELRDAVPLFVFYGLPLTALFLMVCTSALGAGWRGVAVSVLLWAGLAAGFYAVVWPLLDEVTGNQFIGGSVGIVLFFSVGCWAGWLGFRHARA